MSKKSNPGAAADGRRTGTPPSIERDDEVVLEARDVSKLFRGLVALDEVTFDVRQNEIIGLIGPNGAGKTTLFNCISGLYAPSDGRVIFGGQDITGLDMYRIARLGLGRTFQIVRPLRNLTTLENVMVGAHIGTRSRSAAREIADDALDFVGLSPLRDVDAEELTMGNQKKMELARTIATDPDLALFDELLAGLTPTETNEILDLLQNLRDEGTSILIIEHDMQAIMNTSDLVMVLHNGKRLAFDTPEQVSQDDRVVEAYLGDQDA